MTPLGPEIVFEDNHLLVAVKPVNMPTQADATGDRDFLTWLKEYLKIRHQKPGNVFLGLIHRLDRPVGGIMVFAKTSKAAGRLSEQVRDRQFHKSYLAVVHGSPANPAGRLRHYLFKDQGLNRVAVVPATTPGAKEAVLDYQTMATAAGMTLVKVNLLTGRSHQIRVQFAAIGHPLYGDQKYGADRNRPGQQIALWSAGLAFAHPVTKQGLSFQSLPPRQFPWVTYDVEVVTLGEVIHNGSGTETV